MSSQLLLPIFIHIKSLLQTNDAEFHLFLGQKMSWINYWKKRKFNSFCIRKPLDKIQPTGYICLMLIAPKSTHMKSISCSAIINCYLQICECIVVGSLACIFLYIGFHCMSVLSVVCVRLVLSACSLSGYVILCCQHINMP